MKQTLKRVLSLAFALLLVASVLVIAPMAAKAESGDTVTIMETEESEVEAINLDGAYDAYFGLQSPSWTYRDAWNHETNGVGSENWGSFVINNDSGEKYGVVTDAVIAGNGTYTVSIEDLGDVFKEEFANNADKMDCFRMLMVTTNIPKTEGIEITDVELIMDGKTVTTYTNAFIDEDDTSYFKIIVQNEWNPDLTGTLPYYNAPTESIEIQFTISGFNYDKAAEEVQSEVQSESQTEAESSAVDTQSGEGEETAGTSDMNPFVVAIVIIVILAIGASVIVVMRKKKM